MEAVIVGVIGFFVASYVIHYIWSQEDKIDQYREDDGK